MTKVEMFNAIKAVVAGNEEMVAFCDHEIELLSRKRSSSGESRVKREANENAEKLYNALAMFDEPVTIKELQDGTSDAEVAGWSTQRISALVRKLGEDRIVKEMRGKKAYFSVK